MVMFGYIYPSTFLSLDTQTDSMNHCTEHLVPGYVVRKRMNFNIEGLSAL